MSDLSSAVVGTKLKAPVRYSSRFTIKIVDRVTDTQVICGNTRFRKSDGKLIGTTGYDICYARIATESDILSDQIRVAEEALKHVKLTEEALKHVKLTEEALKHVKLTEAGLADAERLIAGCIK